MQGRHSQLLLRLQDRHGDAPGTGAGNLSRQPTVVPHPAGGTSLAAVCLPAAGDVPDQTHALRAEQGVLSLETIHLLKDTKSQGKVIQCAAVARNSKVRVHAAIMLSGQTMVSLRCSKINTYSHPSAGCNFCVKASPLASAVDVA